MQEFIILNPTFRGCKSLFEMHIVSLIPRPLPDFIFAAMEKNREKVWDHCYDTSWKWWTWL